MKSAATWRCVLVAGVAATIAACGGGSGGGNNPPPPPALNITTTSMPNGVVGTAYSQTVAATGGTGMRTFSTTAGSLPNGLALDAASGAISGLPAGPPGTASFTITATDSATPADIDAQPLTLRIIAAGASRNDTIADATPIGNGLYAASISPAGDPAGTFNSDEDYYSISTTDDSVITVDINAQVNGSPLDSVIEIVNASGTVLNRCVVPGYNSPCVSDDEQLGVALDSYLQVQVDGATTIYIHVVDWGSNGRPDKLYDLSISGVN